MIKNLREWVGLPSYSTTTHTPARPTLSQNEIIKIYNQGIDYDIAKEYTKAVQCYRQAAEQGYASAQSNLGTCYKNGEGVVKDYTQAVYWYRKVLDAKKDLERLEKMGY